MDLLGVSVAHKAPISQVQVTESVQNVRDPSQPLFYQAPSVQKIVSANQASS